MKPLPLELFEDEANGLAVLCPTSRPLAYIGFFCAVGGFQQGN